MRSALVAVALAGAFTGCSAGPSQPAGGTSQPAGITSHAADALSSTALPAAAPAELLTEVQRAVDSFDAAAGGPVSGQQSALAALLDDGQQAVQARCAAATTTLKFEPVYARLAPAPGWLPRQGTMSGAVYSLPTLIRIYTGNRITGTDLTDLHLAVKDGRARLPALCLS